MSNEKNTGEYELPPTKPELPVTGEWLQKLGFYKHTGVYVLPLLNGRRLIIFDTLDYMEVERMGVDWSLVIVNFEAQELTRHKVKTAIEILK